MLFFKPISTVVKKNTGNFLIVIYVFQILNQIIFPFKENKSMYFLRSIQEPEMCPYDSVLWNAVKEILTFEKGSFMSNFFLL